MRKIMVLALVAVSTLVVAFAQLQDKTALSLQRFFDERRDIERMTREHRDGMLSMIDPVYVAPRVIDGVEMVDAFIDIDGSRVLPALKRLGVLVNCEFEGFVTAQVPVDRLLEVSRLDGVTGLEVSKQVTLCTDSTLISTRAGEVLNGPDYGLPQAYDGTGVIIGIIDNGFDYQHSAFKTSGDSSKSRIVRVYDVTNDTGHPATLGDNTLPGSIFMDEQIDTLTADSKGTHGTHVASIAAGTHVDGYGGMAPGADIVLCVSPTLNIGLSEVQVVNCIKYINAYADSVGMPCVVSISVSTANGPHDGKDRISRAVAETTGPGHIFVIAAGNTAGRFGYHTGWSRMDKPLSLLLGCFNMRLQCDDSYYYPNVWLDTWGRKGSTRIVAAFNVFDKQTKHIVWESEKISLFTEINLDDIKDYFVPDYTMDSVAYIRGLISQSASAKYEMSTTIRNMKCASVIWDEERGIYVSRYQLGISFYPPKTVYPRQPDSCYLDTWICTYDAARWKYSTSAYVDRPSAEGDSIVSEWVENYYTPASDYCSIGSYAVHDSVISVGAYVARNSFYSLNLGTMLYDNYPIGSVYNVSSYQVPGYGPTGKALPVVMAPGVDVVAAGSRYSYFQTTPQHKDLVRRDADGSLWGAMSGTSMATPTVAGIIAQWLQIKPDMTPSEVKDVIAQTAVKDEFFGNRMGPNGKIDAMAGVQYLLSQMEPEYIPGDLDGSGAIDIDDVTLSIALILGNPDPGTVIEAADFDGNGKVDIDDVTSLIHYLLTGSID